MEEGAGGCEDGGMAEVAGLADPEDGVAPGLVTVQSVHHVLLQVLALQLHLHLCIASPLTSQSNSTLYLEQWLRYYNTNTTQKCKF